MSPQDDGPELQDLFAARRRRDESGAPPFQHVLRRAKSPEASRKARALLRPRFLAVGAVLCLLCGLAVWAGYRWRHSGAPLGAPPPSLTAWKAPTDFLLEVPGGALLDSTPVLVDPRLPSAPLPDRPSGT